MAGLAAQLHLPALRQRAGEPVEGLTVLVGVQRFDHKAGGAAHPRQHRNVPHGAALSPIGTLAKGHHGLYPAQVEPELALGVTLLLALFSILFGTRNLDATEHHRGMVVAIAFESVVKLLAFMAVGGFALWLIIARPSEARTLVAGDFLDAVVAVTPGGLLELAIYTLIAMCAVICLPRQFHVTVVENNQGQDLHWARWLFPLYLFLMGLFIWPLALAGKQWVGADMASDTYVISLPMSLGFDGMAMLAFLGGTSAATGMVIVEAVALSTMVCNDMLLPLLLRRQNAERPFELFRHWMLSARRLSILIILLLGYVCYRLLGTNASLATIGQLSFAAIAQLAPAMFGALVWKQANRRGVFAGLAAGCALWFYTLVLPLVAGGLRWSLDSFPLLPELLYYPVGIEIDPLTRGVLLSLTGNWLLFGAVSWFSRTRVSEHWQAGRFIGLDTGNKTSTRNLLAVQVADLMALAARFVGEERAQQSFERFAQQQAETDQTATAMNQMSATVAEVANSSNNAADAARHADGSARHGHQIVADAIQCMSGLSSQIQNTAAMITQLADDSRNISSVMDAIRGIAEQTNLLALNAAINKALKDPEVLKKLAIQSTEPLGSTPAEYGAYIKKEIARWDSVVKSTGVSLD